MIMYFLVGLFGTLLGAFLFVCISFLLAGIAANHKSFSKNVASWQRANVEDPYFSLGIYWTGLVTWWVIGVLTLARIVGL